MDMTVAIGYSQKYDPKEAAFEAALMARRELNNTTADLIILLTTSRYCLAEIPKIIKSAIQTTHLIGSSTDAILLPDHIITNGIAILVIKSSHLIFTSNAITLNNNTNLRLAGFELTKNLPKEHANHRHVSLLFGNGFLRNSHDFFHGIGEAIGFSSSIIGAVSSAHRHQKYCYQYFNDQMLESHVVTVMISGQSRFNMEYRNGFKILGRPRIATQTNDFIIRSIDNQPASKLYEDFLKENISALKENPLMSYLLYPLGYFDEHTGRYLVRNVVDILPDGSIVCQGDVPQGAEVHLMMSNLDITLTSAEEAAVQSQLANQQKDIQFLFVFESTARGFLLGRHAEREIANIREAVSFKTPLFGMRSFGEICPRLSTQNAKHLTLDNGGILLGAFA